MFIELRISLRSLQEGKGLDATDTVKSSDWPVSLYRPVNRKPICHYWWVHSSHTPKHFPPWQLSTNLTTCTCTSKLFTVDFNMKVRLKLIVAKQIISGTKKVNIRYLHTWVTDITELFTVRLNGIIIVWYFWWKLKQNKLNNYTENYLRKKITHKNNTWCTIFISTISSCTV